VIYVLLTAQHRQHWENVMSNTEQTAKDYLNNLAAALGVEDCKKGIPHDISASAEYTRGYGDQYTTEQNLDNGYLEYEKV